MKKTALHFILVILLILCAATMSTAQASAKKAAADIDKGWQTLDIPLLEKALKTFEEAAKKNPKDHLAPYLAAKAHFTIANCLDIKSDQEFDQTGEGEKHVDAAIELIKTSLAIKENSADTNILKFQVLRLKMYHVSFPQLMMYIADRKAAHAKALELAPDNLTVQLLSAIEVADGWPQPPPETPVAEFEKLTKKDPKFADAFYEIGHTWEKAKKTDEAKKNYEKALKADPNHHWAKKRLKGLAGASGA